MKRHILLFLFFAATWMQAQNYFVSSLATPGAATFTADKIKDGKVDIEALKAIAIIAAHTAQPASAFLILFMLVS